MGTAIIVIILLLLCVYAGYSYRKKLRYGGGCCGEHDAMETKVKSSRSQQETLFVPGNLVHRRDDLFQLFSPSGKCVKPAGRHVG